MSPRKSLPWRDSEQASNHLKLLWAKAMVVSVKEKSRHRIVAGVDQEAERKRTTDEVSKR